MPISMKRHIQMFKIIRGSVIAIFAIFAPIGHLLLTTAVMIFIDLITGIMAAKKRGEAITSAGLRRTLSKLFVYEVSILLAFLAETYMSDVLPFVKLASAMVTLVELQSVYENLNEISGTKLLQVLMDKIGSENIDRTKKDNEVK